MFSAEAIASSPTGIVALTMVILALGICVALYYRGLQARNCAAMTSEFGDKDGYLQSSAGGGGDGDGAEHGLRDYYVKAAFSACNPGDLANAYVSTCMLKSCLAQGCRFIDVEVFSIDDQPVVASSVGDGDFFVKSSFNSVPMAEVLDVLRNYGLTIEGAPNAQDPLLLHLRIKSTNQAMFRNFAKLLQHYDDVLLPKDFDSENYGQNFAAVPVAKLRGKIALLVNRNTTAFIECPDFYRFVNMTTNSVFARCLRYDQVKLSPDTEELTDFNRQGFTVVLPSAAGGNPENPSGPLCRELGCQAVCMRYPYGGEFLDEDSAFFAKNHSAFVLKPLALRYVPETIDAPPPQDPKLSYAPREIKSQLYAFEI
jgi:hypothetical protein